MDPNSLLASRLYGGATSTRVTPDIKSSQSEPSPIPEKSNNSKEFLDVIENGAADFKDAVSNAESQSQKMMQGTADPHSVVEALAAAELAVETAVTVRDRVVEAYQEIIRMQI